MYVEAGLQTAAAAVNAAASAQAYFSVSGLLTTGAGGNEALAASLSSAAGAAGTFAQINQAKASLEVQQDGWQYQLALGIDDNNIAAAQITSAQDQVQIAAQQLNIAQLKATQSSDLLEFLVNKFTNAALYTWMSGVLQDVYSYFLRQATAVARSAENQMAFERQQTPPGFIKADYWQPPSNTGSATAIANTQGLTGSARLTQDIYELDSYYQDTDTRKLQLTKIISLAQLFPIDFQKLRETGVMSFTTAMSLFDQDFPGNYLRLINSVTVNVIAIVPPVQGIRATLSTTAISRVVTGPGVFQKIAVRRDPQSIGFSSPTNATGVFTLDPQSNLLLPFQGMGVEAKWQFIMPLAANPFDYSTLADVQITINYTALDSPDYRVQVLRQLNNQTSADQAYSFDNDFADSGTILTIPTRPRRR